MKAVSSPKLLILCSQSQLLKTMIDVGKGITLIFKIIIIVYFYPYHMTRIITDVAYYK